MAEADWTYLNDGLDIATVDRGVTAGIARPTGRRQLPLRLQLALGRRGSGGPVRQPRELRADGQGRLDSRRRAARPGGGPPASRRSCSSAARATRSTTARTCSASPDDDPHRVVLRKGAVTVGLPTADGPGVLLKSAASFAQATWLHLRLDVIVNTNGDVVLNVFQNDLALHALGTPPDWQPVSGMVEFIDDHLGINSGSQPLTLGRAASASP